MTFIVHITLLFILVNACELGVIGISISTWVTNILNALLLILCWSYKEGLINKESWHWYNKDSFKGWIQFLSLAVPSTIMRSLEYSSIEVLAMFTGWIGYIEQGAAIANFQLFSFTYRIPGGISIASTNLIGNCLGARNFQNARKYSISAIILVLIK